MGRCLAVDPLFGGQCVLDAEHLNFQRRDADGGFPPSAPHDYEPPIPEPPELGIQENTTMSDTKPATTNGDKARTRGPNKPKGPADPVLLAQHVDKQTQGWDVATWDKYNRVLEALRGPQ